MNSIRPLITITILVVAGAFLYVKINEGPVRAPAGPSGPGTDAVTAGVPPLSATSAPAAQTNNAAPPWTSPSPAATLASGAAQPAAPGASVPPSPAVPAIPEIPAVPTAAPPAEQSIAAAASISTPTDLPANIPTARYPDEPAAANDTATLADAAAAPIAPAGITPADTPPTGAIPLANQPAAPAPLSQAPATPEQANSVDVAAKNVSSTPLAAQQNPLRPSAATTTDDRYVAGADAPGSPKTEAPPVAVQPSFATSWPNIQAALDRRELANAHQLLSRWYNDPTLTPTDAEMVESLLSQLAGTVIYSTEHQLEPAYAVKPGDTLETIANEYNVPWQLLAKINGIAAADQVQPGQQFKVVRGPFSAVVDLGRKQLTLMVADRYAGRFPITVPSLAAVSDGQWLVDEKLAVPAASVVQSAYTPPPAAVERAIVLRAEATAGQPTAGATLTIGTGGIAVNSVPGPAATIRVSAQDAEELSDILSIGSRVVVQR
jgi:LysM repeat protein